MYKSVISHVEIPLPEHPMRYSAAPNAIPGQGIWAACGVNEKNVAMTATETITSNPRVLGADPMVVYQRQKTERQKFQVVLERRISLFLSFLILTVPEKV